jgi:hypothetical protein
MVSRKYLVGVVVSLAGVLVASIGVADNAGIQKEKHYRAAEKSAIVAGVNAKEGEVGTKICSVFSAGNWRDSVNVGASFTKVACRQYMLAVGAANWQLACLYSDGIGFGQPNGGVPAQNCGW